METYPHAWLCQQIVEHAHEAIVFADRDGSEKKKCEHAWLT